MINGITLMDIIIEVVKVEEIGNLLEIFKNIGL